ncbi:MAG: hypothetical protein WDW36_005393 [Sanguina aurantia]
MQPSTSTATFAALGITPTLIAKLEEQSFRAPVPIQAAAIPAILLGRNIAIQSFMGSGKTLAYLLPVLELARQRREAQLSAVSGYKSLAVQALIVVPSRQLGIQVMRAAHALLPADLRPLVQQCIGGASQTRQLQALRSKHRPFLVVGTPGRLLELAGEESLKLWHCPLLVLDEADQLDGPGYREHVSALLSHVGKKLPGGRQTVLVSASLHPHGLDRFRDWCPDALFVSPGHTSSIPATATTATTTSSSSSTDSVKPAAADLLSLSTPPAHPASTCPTDATTPPLSAVPPLRLDKQVYQVRRMAPTPSTQIEKSGGQAITRSGRSSGDSGGGSSAGSSSDRVGVVGGGGGAPVSGPPPPHIQHFYVLAHADHKADKMRRVLHAMDVKKALVFMNLQHRLENTMDRLAARNMMVTVLHGRLTKLERANVMGAFLRGTFRAMVVSDAFSRGLDIPDCDAVFNLELPFDAMVYAHRAGRTGRMGAPGVVVSLVGKHEVQYLQRMCKKLGVRLQHHHNQQQQQQQQQEQQQQHATIHIPSTSGSTRPGGAPMQQRAPRANDILLPSDKGADPEQDPTGRSGPTSGRRTKRPLSLADIEAFLSSPHISSLPAHTNPTASVAPRWEQLSSKSSPVSASDASARADTHSPTSRFESLGPALSSAATAAAAAGTPSRSRHERPPPLGAGVERPNTSYAAPALPRSSSTSHGSTSPSRRGADAVQYIPPPLPAVPSPSTPPRHSQQHDPWGPTHGRRADRGAPAPVVPNRGRHLNDAWGGGGDTSGMAPVIAATQPSDARRSHAPLSAGAMPASGGASGVGRGAIGAAGTASDGRPGSAPGSALGLGRDGSDASGGGGGKGDRPVGEEGDEGSQDPSPLSSGLGSGSFTGEFRLQQATHGSRTFLEIRDFDEPADLSQEQHLPGGAYIEDMSGSLRGKKGVGEQRVGGAGGGGRAGRSSGVRR